MSTRTGARLARPSAWATIAALEVSGLLCIRCVCWRTPPLSLFNGPLYALLPLHATSRSNRFNTFTAGSIQRTRSHGSGRAVHSCLCFPVNLTSPGQESGSNAVTGACARPRSLAGSQVLVKAVNSLCSWCRLLALLVCCPFKPVRGPRRRHNVRPSWRRMSEQNVCVGPSKNSCCVRWWPDY